MKSVLQLWANPPAMICVDQWEQGVPSGRVFLPKGQMEYPFHSLTQLLLLLDTYLKRGKLHIPTRSRKNTSPSGRLATLFFQVDFFNHSSWQGRITWQETGQVFPFNSELQLVNLMQQISDRRIPRPASLVYFPKTGYNGA